MVNSRLSLTILIPPAMFDEDTFKKFEQESGIKLYVAYYENSQSLLSKMRTTGGADYDLIMPDDHSIELLKNEGLLKKIVPSKISAWPKLQPQLKGHYFDPSNDYAVPYYLGVYGIGYDTTLLPELSSAQSWQHLFNPKNNLHVCMTDEAREAVLLAALYRFGTINSLQDAHKLADITKVLAKQKESVETYSIERAASLIKARSCPLALLLSSEYLRYKESTPNLGFIIPQEGSLAVIDAFAIPAQTKKDQLIYALINFFLRPDIIMHNAQLYGYCPARTDVSLAQEDPLCHDIMSNVKHYDFLRNVVTDQQINQLWIDVLAQ